MGSEYDDVRLCLAKDACQGGDDPDKQCRKGHKGPYCSVCEDGYYKRGGVCLSCSSSGARLFMTLLPTICFLICLLLYYLWIIRDKFIHYFWNQAGVLAKKADKYHLTGLRTKFKILLAFVQIISQIPFALDVDFPQIYLQFLEILWIFNLDIVEFLNFECIYQRNFYDKLVEATLGPFILMGAILTVLLIRLGVAYRLNSLNPSYPYSQFRKEAIFCSLLLSFVVFSPVSIKVFQTFACEPFEDGSSRLIIDYTIHCSGDEYNFYVIYSIFMILIYPIGVPALYFTLLYMNHDQVNPPTRLVVRDSERHLVSNVIIQQEKIKLRNSYHEIFIISFLYIAYEPRRWYFEILDCFRRLMMTAVPVLIMRGAITQIIIVLLVSLSCIAAYMELKPYTTKSDNTVAVFSQWAITLTLIVAILLRIDEGTGLNRQTLGIIAILINSTVFVITVLLILFSDEEFNPTVEMENIERQTQINNNKRKKTSTMKLSHFIEKQSVEMIEKKNSEDETTEVSESSKSEKSQSSVSRKSGSISQRSMKAKIKETSEIDETEPKRVSSISFKNPDINILSKKRSSTNSEETEIRRESFDSSHTPNRGRLSRLVKRDEKDSDDESNSDDEQDSDDDTSNTTHNKRKPDKHPPGAVTNPLNQVHKNI